MVVGYQSCQPTTDNLQHTTYNIQPTTYNIQPTTYKMKSYKDLEIYKESFDLAVRVYHLTMKLPAPDKFETGSQIRRSSQSIKDNIVEGYGRRSYKADFIRFLIFSHSSLLESTSQSEFLATIHPKKGWEEISTELDNLGKKISKFIDYVEKNWKPGKPDNR
jgi:four helix bundle protein